jgi:hypothetical protein
MEGFYDFTTSKLDAGLMEEWVQIIGDWLTPFEDGISREDIERIWSDPGWSVRFQHINGTLYRHDPGRLCEKGGGISGYDFNRDRCSAATQILM